MTDFARPLSGVRTTSERLAEARALIGLAAFAVVFALLIFVIETLSLVGVPQLILLWMIIAFALAVPALAAISTRTVSLTEFAVAGRQLGPSENTMAASVGLFGAVFAVGLAAAFFRSEAEMSALALGLGGGLLVSGILFAPYLRRAASQSLGDFLAMRFGGRAVSAVTGLIVVAALFPMLIAELSLAGMIGSWTLSIGRPAFITMATILMLVPVLIGGMRGVTVAGVLQFILVLTALAFASIWVSGAATGYTLPLAGYVAAAAELYAGGNASLSAQSAWSLAGLGLCVTLGVAAFPTLLSRWSAAGSTRTARTALARTLLMVALFSIASVSLGAIAKWVLVESTKSAGSTAELLSQPWIVDWVARGETLVMLCGEPASEAGAACAAGPLKAADLAIDPNIALLAAPDMVGLPPLVAMLLAAGCLAASIAAGSLLILGIARALGHDLLFRAAAPRMPASRRLLLQRFLLLLVAGAAAHFANGPPADYMRLALISLSLAASGLFPVLLIAIWWRRANRYGALCGMLVGFAIAAYLVAAEIHNPQLVAWLEPAGLADLARFLGADKAALLAIPCGLVAAVIVSLLMPPPDTSRTAFAESLLVARDMPAEDDTE